MNPEDITELYSEERLLINLHSALKNRNSRDRLNNPPRYHDYDESSTEIYKEITKKIIEEKSPSLYKGLRDEVRQERC